ncbi:YibE/F family protein [Nanchangia anserum]|nr:YibE/F family protein [Nanchangia anserum]
MHVHAGETRSDLAPRARRRARIVLAAIVAPLLIATIVGLVILHPGHATRIGSLPEIAQGMESASVRVVDKPLSQCQLEGVETDESGSLLQSAVCATVLNGQGAGMTVPVHVPPEYTNDIHVGTVIKVLYNPNQVMQGTPYLFWDIERSLPMWLLAAVYVVLVVAVAGKRGFAALVGLLASSLVLIGFVVPALMAGSSPLAVTIVGAAAMLFVSVYLAHGVTIRTTMALLGTFVGLGVTILLALWGVRAATL